MRRTLALLLLPAFAFGFVACSDDDDDAESDTTTTDAPGSGDTSSSFDEDEVTEQLETAILGEGAESDWHVSNISGDEITISPDDGVDVTEGEASTVCSAVVTVAFNVLPTAVVTVTDGAGEPLITSEGAVGCHPVDED